MYLIELIFMKTNTNLYLFININLLISIFRFLPQKKYAEVPLHDVSQEKIKH